MDKEVCWLCGDEARLVTSWKVDDGEHGVCAECDRKIDQIIKHYGSRGMTEKTWNIEVTREDVMNISKWMAATSMMIEAKMRTPYSESEHSTWRKFQHIYHSSTLSRRREAKNDN